MCHENYLTHKCVHFWQKTEIIPVIKCKLSKNVFLVCSIFFVVSARGVAASFGCVPPSAYCTWISVEDSGPPGHFLRQQLALCPLCSLAQPPCPAPFREGLNCHHCQRPVMLWLCCPVTRPAWSGGNLQTITLHNRFYYHLFAHSHAAVFSNNCSQGRVTPITSQCSSHNAHLHSHRPHVIVDCKLSLLIVIKILTISKLIAGLSCFFLIKGHASWHVTAGLLAPLFVLSTTPSLLSARLLTSGVVTFLLVKEQGWKNTWL